MVVSMYVGENMLLLHCKWKTERIVDEEISDGGGEGGTQIMYGVKVLRTTILCI